MFWELTSNLPKKHILNLLTFTPKGIYCPQAAIYIDPCLPVKRALITHGHADHSRFGHQYYLCTDSAKPVIKYRLGKNINIQSVPYGKSTFINGVQFSFHPAGHILGSAQIRVEHRGQVWVASGDYKLEADGISEVFEPIKCHAFITESTFGLPKYSWEPQAIIAQKINAWWRKNKAAGKTSILGAYALGKAQRLLPILDSSIGKIYTHGAVENINKVIRAQGINLPPTIRITQQLKRKVFAGNLIICPPGYLQTSWIKKFPAAVTGICSGWMQDKERKQKTVINNQFALSDHADWEGLNKAVKTTEAESIFVIHGYTAAFAKWLNKKGLKATSITANHELSKAWI